MTDESRLPGATHLECTATGQRFDSEQLIGLSPAGKPLFARYDLDALKAASPPRRWPTAAPICGATRKCSP